MKKIISSAIAIAMLSSTVAMAAPVVAPTPQNVTTTYTQDFNGELSRPVENNQNWVVFGSGKTQVGYGDEGHSVTQVVFGADATDKVLQNKGNGKNVSLQMSVNETLDANDVFKISFDAALKNGVTNSNFQLSVDINGGTEKTVLKTLGNGWTNGSYNGVITDGWGQKPASDSLTHYEVTFNRATKEITYNCGTQTKTYTYTTDIESIQKITLLLENNSNGNAEAPVEFYADNLSYSVTRVIDEVPNEKVEWFDTVQPDPSPAWYKKPKCTNAKGNFCAKIDNTQDIDDTSNRGKVLKAYDVESDNTLVMPLDYTMDNDDVFTFKFDYAEAEHSADKTLEFRLEDSLATPRRDMGFTFTDPTDSSKTYSTNSSTVFAIAEGKVRIASNWESQGAAMSANEFHTITVVIDNSDEAYPDASGNAQRTLAIYVDGALQKNTKWIMADKDGKESSNTINGVSLYFSVHGGTHYFDNLWASLADNDIKVDDNDVSYTYPVVYDTDTNAIFVKAYYDTNNRLISADTESATPSEGRTVTTTLNKPTGTVKTKVFRWDSLDGIHQLSPAYDSSKTSTTN